jgi:ADP-ribose pyrophosphatase YjhB (NUDIX family)
VARRWAPVGGGIEAGETAEEAAVREVAEETAVEMRLVGPVGTREFAPDPAAASPWASIRLEVFAAEWLAGEPIAGSDAAEARFVAVAAVESFDLMPGVAPWIAAAWRLFDGQER